MPADAWKTAAVALTAVLLVGDKLKGELQMWQTNLLMLFLFTAALRLLDRRPALAGAVLGLAFNIKYLPIVFLPYLLLRRRWTAAAAFVASVVGFALLPAVLTGWDVNLHNQAIAYSGLLRLMGVPVGARAANIDGITAEFSVSIPSGVARLAGAGGSASIALAAAGLVALAAAAVAAWMYRRNGVPFLYRPDGFARRCHHARSSVWNGRHCVTAVLVFSPQTNTRHLSVLLLVQTLAVLLLASPRPGVSRRPLLVGTAMLVLGLVFPPGTQDFGDSGGDLVRRAAGGLAPDRRPLLVRPGHARYAALGGTARPYSSGRLCSRLACSGADAARLASVAVRDEAA